MIKKLLSLPPEERIKLIMIAKTRAVALGEEFIYEIKLLEWVLN